MPVADCTLGVPSGELVAAHCACAACAFVGIGLRARAGELAPLPGRNSLAPAENLNSCAAALRVRVSGVGRGDDQGECAGVRRAGVRFGLVGALSDDVDETEDENPPEDRTADMPSGVWGGNARRNDDERETDGRFGVVEPCDGRGGSGVDDGCRSSRWRCSSARISGSRFSGSCVWPGGGGQRSCARSRRRVTGEQTYVVSSDEDGRQERLERVWLVLFVDAVVLEQVDDARHPANGARLISRQLFEL